MSIIKENGAEAKMFIDKNMVDTGTIKQIRSMISHPSVEHARIMPDCHKGNGCCVGFTCKLNEKIVPNFIGGDIGCGILTYPIGKRNINLKSLDSYIKAVIPLQEQNQSSNCFHKTPIVTDKELEDLFFKSHQNAMEFNDKFKKKWNIYLENYIPVYSKFWFDELCEKIGCNVEKELKQLGTLGGGNHFIEVNQNEETGEKYITIHSGSRSLGTHICKYHQNKIHNSGKYEEGEITKWEDIEREVRKFKKSNQKKKEIKQFEDGLIAKYHEYKKSNDNKKLKYLEPPDTYEYYFDMIFAQNYAQLNRRIMLRLILKQSGIKFQEETVIESIHNYIDFNDFILRKGAISNYNDRYCIISLNMRDGILLCFGKSDEDWNYSTAHGSGRLVPRNVAKQKFTLRDFQKTMIDVYSTSVSKSTIDESPMCYKDSQLIMNLVSESVEIIAHLKPILNVKG